MVPIPDDRIAAILEPYLNAPQLPASNLAATPLDRLVPRIAAYLELLLRWNRVTNLSAIREPEALLERQVGESLFAARVLGSILRPGDAVLDFGSGAGFPGLPIQLLYPDLTVTLAESQNKKAAFLNEAIRTLGVLAQVWPRRVEELPAGTQFQAVTLRAVDRMAEAVAEAGGYVASGGYVLTFDVERSSTADAQTFHRAGMPGFVTLRRQK